MLFGCFLSVQRQQYGRLPWDCQWTSRPSLYVPVADRPMAMKGIMGAEGVMGAEGGASVSAQLRDEPVLGRGSKDNPRR